MGLRRTATRVLRHPSPGSVLLIDVFRACRFRDTLSRTSHVLGNRVGQVRNKGNGDGGRGGEGRFRSTEEDQEWSNPVWTDGSGPCSFMYGSFLSRVKSKMFYVTDRL